MKRRFVYVALFVLIGIYYFFFQTHADYKKTQGFIFGTYYSITYDPTHVKDADQLEADVQTALDSVNKSLSTFDPNSTISLINTNKNPKLDAHFLAVYNEGRKVSEITHGAFDMTVAPLVNVWGFGFHPDSLTNLEAQAKLVHRIMTYCGYQTITIEGEYLKKDFDSTMLDASAIAKGYGVDVAASVFNKYHVENYLIDIGGEIVCKGNNPKGDAWSIGIDKPIDDCLASHRELQDTLCIHSAAVATSGDYRQFYIKDGVKYSHTIDPHTGYPVNHSTLSTTVVTTNCMRADAFATAFMVLDLDSAFAIANAQDSLELYVIYSGPQGELQVRYTSGFKKYLRSSSSN